MPETVQQMAEVMWEGVPVLQLIGSACARRPASDQESLALELHNLTDEVCKFIPLISHAFSGRNIILHKFDLGR